jgi:opacity protein-like surface antigen
VKSATTTTLAILVSTMAASVALAQESERTTPLLDDGTQELSVSGTIDIPESDEIDYDIEGSYGYFLRDGLEVGVEISGSDLDGADRIEIGGFTEYNFRRDQTLVPYVGGGLGIASASFDETINLDTPIDDEDGLVFNVEGGVKFFFVPYLAVSASIDFSVATEDLFETEEAIEDNLTSIRVGMRYYF